MRQTCESGSQRRYYRLAAAQLSWLAVFYILPDKSLAMHTLFLETNMRAAWPLLLGAGSTHEGGPRGVLEAMLTDCHDRKSGAWGAECDRAMYLESVLEKFESDVVEGEQRASDSVANEVAIVPAEHLPFSAFFLEYALSRRPVIISDGTGDGETGRPIDQNHLTGKHHPLDPDIAENTLSSEGRSLVDDRLLEKLSTCLPYPDSTAGTVEGTLWACQTSGLENLSVPLYVAGDFAQRFRRKDVLPPGKHLDVQRFVSG